LDKLLKIGKVLKRLCWRVAGEAADEGSAIGINMAL
jgi:hypothetical protein